MAAQATDPAKRIKANITALKSAGLQQTFDVGALRKSLAPPLAMAQSLALPVPRDDSKETIDIVFDAKTGDIIGWRKTPRTTMKGMVTLNIPLQETVALPGINPVVTFVVDKILRGAITAIAREIDEAIKKREVLQFFDKALTLPPVKPKDKEQMAGKRVLLLIHGIFSKTSAAFEGLVPSYDGFKDIYGDNIIAYDHFTLSKTTKENARNLINQLPKGTTVDIVCHSRGAGVTRFLVENAANRKILKDNHIDIGKVCFVAGACEGSPLATKEAADSLFKLLAQMMVLSGWNTQPWVKALGLVIRAMVSGVQQFPGVLSMNPGGAEVKTLSGSKSTAAQRYCYIRANFDPSNLIARFADEAIIDKRVFKGAANDCIVPWNGASASKDYLPDFADKENVLGFDTDGGAQGTVWHTNFFVQPSVRNQLLANLK